MPKEALLGSSEVEDKQGFGGAMQTFERGRKSDISCACHWTVNVAATKGHGKLFGEAYQVSTCGIFVPPDSKVKTPEDLAGVPAALIVAHGAVSEPVAQAMAAGIRARAGTNVGIGITGIAGPGGGTPDKPVGTVAIAVVADQETRVRTFQFIGPREMVKFQAAQSALNMTRLLITGLQGQPEWAERKSKPL